MGHKTNFLQAAKDYRDVFFAIGALRCANAPYVVHNTGLMAFRRKSLPIHRIKNRPGHRLGNARGRVAAAMQ